MVMKLKLIQDRRGYSLTFWTVFFGFILIPILALSIELGRYFYARAEIAKAADAAALAAAAEISQRVFEETGDLQPTSKTWANAQAFASMNNSYLATVWGECGGDGDSVDAGGGYGAGAGVSEFGASRFVSKCGALNN
jgi:Flp pilus assembly protein TadG